MPESQRASLTDAARSLAALAQAGNVDGLRSRTIASVAANFDGIASTVRALAPDLAGASLRATGLYLLEASDAPAGQDEVQFFCGHSAGNAQVSFAIPQLPPGKYAFVMVEATGVKAPERLSMLLQDTAAPASPASWQLAGFFPRPLLSAGHDGVWYWRKARDFHKAGKDWDAYFFDLTARALLQPADFLSSANLGRLDQEAASAMPAGLPVPTAPMKLTIGAPGAEATLPVTDLHTDGAFGGLDLVIAYDASDVSDPVKARAKTVALMKAMLAQHPELKDGFHGLWVFANAAGQPPFALELPMGQIGD